AAALANCVVHDALVLADHMTIDMHDVAGRHGFWLQTLDNIGVSAGRDEADVLTVRPSGNRKIKLPGQGSDISLRQVAEWEPQHVQLLTGGREQEVTLIAVGVPCTSQFGACRAFPAANVMAGGECVGSEFLGGVEQVTEL